MKKAATFLAGLEQRFMASLVANGTYVMRWLAVAHAFLQRVDRRCFKHRNHGVTVFFSRPVFELHELLFKLLFVAQQRRILYLYGRDAGLKLNDDTLKLYELGVALCIVGRGGDVSASLRKAGDCCEEYGERVCHSSSNV